MPVTPWNVQPQTSFHKTSSPTIRPVYKTSPATKRPRLQNVPCHKTSFHNTSSPKKPYCLQNGYLPQFFSTNKIITFEFLQYFLCEVHILPISCLLYFINLLICIYVLVFYVLLLYVLFRILPMSYFLYF